MLKSVTRKIFVDKRKRLLCDCFRLLKCQPDMRYWSNQI